MSDRIYTVLFLCTGNSARSILAEAILNRDGVGGFRAFSAGSHPKGEVHPQAVRLLEELNYPVGQLRPKGWEEFAEPGAPRSISFLRSATMRPEKSAPRGPASQ